MLALKGVVAGYGGFDILHGVDLEVRRGEIVAIVGPNGSGKSTVFKAIYGLIKIPELTSAILSGRTGTWVNPMGD